MQNTLPELITPVLYRMDDVSAHEEQRTRRCTAGQSISEGIWQ